MVDLFYLKRELLDPILWNLGCRRRELRIQQFNIFKRTNTWRSLMLVLKFVQSLPESVQLCWSIKMSKVPHNKFGFFDCLLQRLEVHKRWNLDLTGSSTSLDIVPKFDRNLPYVEDTGL